MTNAQCGEEGLDVLQLGGRGQYVRGAVDEGVLPKVDASHPVQNEERSGEVLPQQGLRAKEGVARVGLWRGQEVARIWHRTRRGGKDADDDEYPCHPHHDKSDDGVD